MKAIYRNLDSAVVGIVADDYAESIAAGYTLSGSVSGSIPSDTGTYFYGDRINGFKYYEGGIVPRSISELKTDIDFDAIHGQFVALREVTAKRVADAGEAKVFGLVTKKFNGGSLTSAEQTFVDNYVAARETILSEHNSMKQAILDSMTESVSGI
jgi:hypothetical protein